MRPVKDDIFNVIELLKDSANRMEGILEFLKHVPKEGSSNQDDKDRVKYQIEAELRNLENTKNAMNEVVARLQDKKTKI